MPTITTIQSARSASSTVSSALTWAVVLCCVLTACAAPQSTRLTVGDLNYIVAEIDGQLAESDFLLDRTDTSEPIRIMINKVVNLTGDVITPAEQWMLMARVRDRLARSATLRRKNVSFQIEPEQQLLVRAAGFEGDFGPTEPPTHVMSAVFRSAARTGADEQAPVDRRLDYYYLEYRIMRIFDNELVWTGQVEFKREALGLTID